MPTLLQVKKHVDDLCRNVRVFKMESSQISKALSDILDVAAADPEELRENSYLVKNLEVGTPRTLAYMYDALKAMLSLDAL
jgi:hypothetical protein